MPSAAKTNEFLIDHLLMSRLSRSSKNEREGEREGKRGGNLCTGTWLEVGKGEVDGEKKREKEREREKGRG